LVHSLGGRITARGGEGRGNVFRVELPCAPKDSLIPPPPKRSPSQSALRRGRLLFIDDDRLVLKMLLRVFEPEHEAVATPSATEALKIVVEEPAFDVIFCDLMMPNTSGMMFFQKLIEAAPRYSDRVVFMTGGAFSVEAQRFLASVPNAHVAKPFDLDAVRTLVLTRIRDSEHARES
jgi:CheY-like chemotaxis protein